MRRTAQIAIGLVISLLAFALAFRGANLAEVAAVLWEANYLFLVPAVALIWLGLYMRALSWRVILGGRVPYWRVYDAMNEGYLLNNLLPFRLGEFGRAYLISRGQALSAAQALSSVVVERVIDLLMVLVMLAAFLPLVAGLDLARAAGLVSAALGLGALAGLVLIARYRAILQRLVGVMLRRFRFRWLHAERWEARVGGFLDGLAVLQEPRRAFLAAFWSGMAWVAAGLGTWVLLLAFLPDARPAMGFFVLTLLGLGIAIPSAPGSAGVFEFVGSQALAVFGVDSSVALSFAVTFHVAHLGLTTLLGGLALAREGETLADLAHAAQALLRTARQGEPAGDENMPVAESPHATSHTPESS